MGKTKKNIKDWQPYVIVWLIGILTLVVIGAFAVFLLTQDNKRIRTQSHLSQLDSNVDSQLSLRLQTLQILAQSPLLVDLLLEQSMPDNPELLALLNGIKSITRASIVYIMKGDGTVVGCSVYGNNKTLTGKNYSFRPYFQQAMTGTTVVYPALGVTTNKRGIYLSVPVRATNNDLLGVAVLKIGLTDIDALLAAETEPAVLVSPEGVIFASNQPGWLYKTIKPLSTELLRQLTQSKQFANETLLPLEWDLDNSSVQIDNNSYEIFTSLLSIPGWRIIICRNTESNSSLLIVQKQLLLLGFAICTLLLTIIVFLIKNIRQRKRTEQQLASHQEELEDIIIKRTEELTLSNKQLKCANKSKSQFLANMSHEIRTPMNAIIGFTDMALTTKMTDEQRDYLLSVSHAGNFLLSLINDILDFSKIEAGKLDTENVEFVLQEFLENLHAINSGRAKEKDLDLSINSLPELNRKLIGDHFRLQQILTNLIGNAIKFTSKGGIRVNTKITNQTEDSATIEFAVTDTGIGIAKERQALIFEAFTQADGSVTRNFGGTGLGLTISNQLIKILGGTMLHVTSEEGKGSTFYFSLPFKLGEPVERTQQQAEVKDIPTNSVGYSILLVEDNLVNITLASRLLEKQGHTITVAENGKLGVEAASKKDFDLILMDMQMPQMDGLQATRKIRRMEKKSAIPGRHVPIIAMTANAMQGDKERCLDAGMDDYVTKPIKIDILNQVICRCLAKCKQAG